MKSPKTIKAYTISKTSLYYSQQIVSLSISMLISKYYSVILYIQLLYICDYTFVRLIYWASLFGHNCPRCPLTFIDMLNPKFGRTFSFIQNSRLHCQVWTLYSPRKLEDFLKFLTQIIWICFEYFLVPNRFHHITH